MNHRSHTFNLLTDTKDMSQNGVNIHQGLAVRCQQLIESLICNLLVSGYDLNAGATKNTKDIHYLKDFINKHAQYLFNNFSKYGGYAEDLIESMKELHPICIYYRNNPDETTYTPLSNMVPCAYELNRVYYEDGYEDTKDGHKDFTDLDPGGQRERLESIEARYNLFLERLLVKTIPIVERLTDESRDQFISFASEEFDKLFNHCHEELSRRIRYRNIIFRTISYNSMTYDVCIEAIKVNGMNIGSVPKHMITLDMVKMSIESHPMAILYVKKADRTLELCKLSLKGGDYTVVEKFPEKHFTPEFCRELIDAMPESVTCFPEDRQTDEMIEYAVHRSPKVLSKLRQNRHYPKLYEIAIDRPSFKLSYVPYDRRTRDLSRRAFKRSATNFRYIPEEHMTEDMYIPAITLDAYSINYVPERDRTHELKIYALETFIKDKKYEINMYYGPDKGDYILENIPQPFHYLRHVLAKDPRELDQAPKDHLTYEAYSDCLSTVMKLIVHDVKNGVELNHNKRWIPVLKRLKNICKEGMEQSMDKKRPRH